MPSVDALIQQLRDSPELRRRFLEAALLDLTGLPQNFLSWLPAFLEANPPLLPISQITGFTQFLPQMATATGDVTTTSETYTTLTGNPTLSDLPDGEYLVYIQFAGKSSAAGGVAIMSFSTNGGAANDEDAATSQSTDNEDTHSSWSRATLNSGGDNTLEARYRSNDAAKTATFQYRKILAWKVGNL